MAKWQCKREDERREDRLADVGHNEEKFPDVVVMMLVRTVTMKGKVHLQGHWKWWFRYVRRDGPGSESE
jgi:hypothetical protein